MKAILLGFFMLFSCFVTAQAQVLEMSKTGTEKVRTFKENKRVKVKTLEGEKYIGRFQIVDDQTIEIEGHLIPVNSISNIKSRSVLAGIAGTALIIYGSLVILSGGLGHIHPNHSSLANGLLITGTLITSAGIFFNEFARNQRSDKWTYKISTE